MIVQNPPFDEHDRCKLYVLGMLQTAECLRFVKDCGDAPRLTASGLSEFAQLRAAGYRPTKRLALGVLVKLVASQKEARMMWKLIQRLETVLSQ